MYDGAKICCSDILYKNRFPILAHISWTTNNKIRFCCEYIQVLSLGYEYLLILCFAKPQNSTLNLKVSVLFDEWFIKGIGSGRVVDWLNKTGWMNVWDYCFVLGWVELNQGAFHTMFKQGETLCILEIILVSSITKTPTSVSIVWKHEQEPMLEVLLLYSSSVSLLSRMWATWFSYSFERVIDY